MNGAGFRLPRAPLAYAPELHGGFPLAERPMQWSFASSVLLHVLVILLITFKDFDPSRLVPPELEVVLVNSKSPDKPTDALRRAQSNLDGGGNTDEDRVLKTPMAAVNDELARQASETEQRVARLEGEARTLMAKIRAEQSVRQQTQGAASGSNSDGQRDAHSPAPSPQAATASDSHGLDPSAEGTAFARQMAEISRNYDAYQKRPRRKEVGGRAVAYVFARYEDEYRTKVERVGTDNYPAPHDGKPVYGKVRLTVSVKADGSIEKIALKLSSGDPYLDTAARSIVERAAPFGKFTPDMLKEADVLDITRTFTFTRLADGMRSE
ncbi:MAG: TonB family protein [Pseudomonadota bacterium]|nr:TonB family protein [Pseudomonadota bacterium]